MNKTIVHLIVIYGIMMMFKNLLLNYIKEI